MYRLYSPVLDEYCTHLGRAEAFSIWHRHEKENPHCAHILPTLAWAKLPMDFFILRVSRHTHEHSLAVFTDIPGLVGIQAATRTCMLYCDDLTLRYLPYTYICTKYNFRLPPRSHLQ